MSSSLRGSGFGVRGSRLTSRRIPGQNPGSRCSLRGRLVRGRISRSPFLPWDERTRGCWRAWLLLRQSSERESVRRGERRLCRGSLPRERGSRPPPLKLRRGRCGHRVTARLVFLVRIGQQRHLVAALRTRVDDRERAALGRTNRLQLHPGCRRATQRNFIVEAPFLAGPGCRGRPAVAARFRASATPTGVSRGAARGIPRSQ